MDKRPPWALPARILVTGGVATLVEWGITPQGDPRGALGVASIVFVAGAVGGEIVQHVLDRGKQWNVESVRAETAQRDWQAVRVFDAIATAATQHGLEFGIRPTFTPRVAIDVVDCEVGRVGEVAVVFYPNGKPTRLELEFGWMAAEQRRPARGRVKALLGLIGRIDPYLGSMADEAVAKGIGDSPVSRPLADQSPTSMGELVRVVARFNAHGAQD